MILRAFSDSSQILVPPKITRHTGYVCTDFHTFSLQFESDEFYFWLSSPVKPPFLLTSLKGKQPLDPTLKKISKKAMSPRGFSTKRYVATSKVRINFRHVAMQVN